jgi:hypothetical protein
MVFLKFGRFTRFSVVCFQAASWSYIRYRLVGLLRHQYFRGSLVLLVFAWSSWKILRAGLIRCLICIWQLFFCALSLFANLNNLMSKKLGNLHNRTTHRDHDRHFVDYRCFIWQKFVSCAWHRCLCLKQLFVWTEFCQWIMLALPTHLWSPLFSNEFFSCLSLTIASLDVVSNVWSQMCSKIHFARSLTLKVLIFA